MLSILITSSLSSIVLNETSIIFDVGFKNEDTISTISIIKTIYNKIFVNKGKDRFLEKNMK
jgi:hypothetical protein